MKHRLIILAALLISITGIFLPGCQKELDGPPVGPGPGEKTVIAGIRGTVIDENNLPVAGATVTSGTKTTITDQYGNFQFKNISLAKSNGYVKVSKTGYFPGSRSFVSVAGRTHIVRIQLLPKTNAGSFSGSSGGTVNLSGGAKLSMPASAIVDASGNPYSGTVNVAMTWIDPKANNLAQIMPGDLRGINASGQEMGLQTFGMIGVELTGTSGQSLKMASDKSAELSFPIPASMSATAPSTIELWHFDETDGRWEQDGMATRSGNYYIASVKHFSFWNCDAQFQVINLCMNLVDAVHGQPLNAVGVRITRQNGSSGYGITDSAGNLCGKVPLGESLVLEVLDQCGGTVFTQNIGPFTGDASLGTIAVTIPSINNLVIEGTLTNCSGGNVTNGAAVIYTSNNYTYIIPVTNGTFSLTLLRCNSGILNFDVLGVDYSTTQQGNLVSGSGSTGTVNVGNVQACGTSSAEFINYMIDSNPYNFSAPPDSLGSWVNSGVRSVGVQKFTGGMVQSANFSFTDPSAAGTVALNGASLFFSSTVQSQNVLTVNPTVTITSVGPVTSGFIEGNFSIQMDFAGTPKNVNCNFRVRRN